jgi:geranylgeranyl diphosphate synthase type II
MDRSKEIDEIIERRINSLDLFKSPQELYEPLIYMLSIGGKRLRPKIALTTYSLFREDMNDSIILPAIALEVFHGFTLIHDDIMDKAPLRRGHETVHIKWDSNTAILSGDVMCIKSYEYLAHAPGNVMPELLRLFTKTAAEVCEGQQFDMNFESRESITIEDYINMIGLKTAALIACSAKVGAIIGEADSKKADILYDFAYQLGLAFQITDDYLDTFSNSNTFGKEIGGDIMNNKKTWLLVEAMAKANSADRVKLETLLAGKYDDPAAKIREVTGIFERSGARRSAEEAINTYHRRALDILEEGSFPEMQKKVLMNFADILINRTK